MTGQRSTRALAKLDQLPFVTAGIIALNVIVAIITRWDLDYYSDIYVRTYGLIPAHFRPGSLLTSAFLHDGYLHLSLNMILLYVFGSQVERAMGKLEYMMFYIGGCFISSLAHVAIVYASLPPYYATLAVVGASGAVASVMGVYAVRFHRKVFRFAGGEVPALLLIMGWLVLQLVLGILGLYRDQFLGFGLKQVGYWSHLGGFAFGIAVALASNMALAGEREYLIGKAEEHSNEGNLLEAIRDHETLLQYDPGDADSHAELARLWALLEEREESLRYYHVAIELYISQGKEDRAIDAADEMQRFWIGSDTNASTRFRLATYLEESGETQRALEAFEQIVSEDPESVEAQMSLIKIGHLQLNVLHEREAAAATLYRFVEQYPRSEWLEFAKETAAQARGERD